VECEDLYHPNGGRGGQGSSHRALGKEPLVPERGRGGSSAVDLLETFEKTTNNLVVRAPLRDSGGASSKGARPFTKADELLHCLGNDHSKRKRGSQRRPAPSKYRDEREKRKNLPARERNGNPCVGAYRSSREKELTDVGERKNCLSADPSRKPGRERGGPQKKRPTSK